MPRERLTQTGRIELRMSDVGHSCDASQVRTKYKHKGVVRCTVKWKVVLNMSIG